MGISFCIVPLDIWSNNPMQGLKIKPHIRSRGRVKSMRGEKYAGENAKKNDLGNFIMSTQGENNE